MHRPAVDVIGLCVTARNEDYVAATLAACDDDGPCTAIGHARTLSAAGAALVNGTAAHGEDFDDTFEGGPVHAGAVVVPAVLAACERHDPDGAAALRGIAVGVEALCRLSLVAPKAVHKAGFHPTAVFGAMGAAAGVAAALGLDRRQTVDALGIAGSMASGIIEYLAEGAWTKRMHAGWAAQSGLRAALMARAGFSGPRTVFEGTHGLFHGFAHTTDGNYDALLGDFGDALGDRDARLQALSVRDDDASLHRLRAAARGARHQAGGHRGDRLRRRRGHGAPAVGAARRQAEAARTAMRPSSRSPTASRPASCAAMSGSAPSPTTPVQDARVLARGRRRSATGSTRTIPIRTNSPATSARRCATAAWSRSASRISAAARKEPLTRADIEDKFALNCRHGGWDDGKSQGRAEAGAIAL